MRNDPITFCHSFCAPSAGDTALRISPEGLPILLLKILDPPFERLHSFHRPLEAVGNGFGLLTIKLQIFEGSNDLIVVVGDAVDEQRAGAASKSACRRVGA